MKGYADLWSFLVTLTLCICAVTGLVRLSIPGEDAPWAPFDLQRPIGRATSTQIAAYEVPREAVDPIQVEERTEACMATLRQAGVQVERAPDLNDGGFCVVRGAVRITGGTTPLSPSVIMQCPLAVRFVTWDRQVLQPTAERVLGSRVARIDNAGSYSCRRIYGSTQSQDRPSEHARANALDVVGMRLEDGRSVSVLADFDGAGPAGAEGSVFLRTVRQQACRVFSTVLGPDYNDAHADHFHFDGSTTGLCS